MSYFSEIRELLKEKCKLYEVCHLDKMAEDYEKLEKERKQLEKLHSEKVEQLEKIHSLIYQTFPEEVKYISMKWLERTRIVGEDEKFPK